MNLGGIGISILGDSISTYAGYNPAGYAVYYADDLAYENGMESVRDTWWMQVIEALGGILCVNDSFSGSTVAGQYFPAASGAARCAALRGAAVPDLILIYMGTNDRGLRIPLGEPGSEDGTCFCGAYRRMLRNIERSYPEAKVVCATLPEARGGGAGDARYNAAIASVVREEGCVLADLASYGVSYETLDGLHPTREGHKTLAALWLRALGKAFGAAPSDGRPKGGEPR